MFIHIIDLKTLNCESKNFISGKDHAKKSEAQKQIEQNKGRNLPTGLYKNLKYRADATK